MQNPFTLFDMDITFNIDKQRLSTQYLKLQKQCHPDNFTTASSQQQLQAIQQAAQINDAYQILKNPLKRAEAIFALNTNQEIPAEETVQDVDFLMTQLIQREKLATIQATQDIEQLLSLQQETETLQQVQLTELAQAIQDKSWEQVKILINRLKFVEKLSFEIAQLEEAFYDQ